MFGMIKRLLGIASLSLVPAATVAQTATDTDIWEAYQGTREGSPALIMFNVSGGESLPAADLPCLVLTLSLQHPGPEGLPMPEEGDMLFRLEDAFEPVIAAHRALDLGRVTMQGTRRVFLVAKGDSDDLAEALIRAAAPLGYSASHEVVPEPARQVVRDLLSPTPDEARVIKDNWVLRQLAENGDIAGKVRSVDHWAYFPTREIAETFARWAMQAGFEEVRISTVEGELPFQVRSIHQGTMEPGAVSAWTLLQDRKARELDGNYDGWETFVMR